MLSASQVLREIVARAGASPCFPLHGPEIAPFWTLKPFACQQASERGPEAPEDRLGAQGAQFVELEVYQQQVWAKMDEEAVVLVAARSNLLHDVCLPPRPHARQNRRRVTLSSGP